MMFSIFNSGDSGNHSERIQVVKISEIWKGPTKLCVTVCISRGCSRPHEDKGNVSCLQWSTVRAHLCGTLSGATVNPSFALTVPFGRLLLKP